MKLKFLTLNNRADRSIYLRVFDEDQKTYDIEMTADQLLVLLVKLCNVIWTDYILVPRD